MPETRPAITTQIFGVCRAVPCTYRDKCAPRSLGEKVERLGKRATKGVDGGLMWLLIFGFGLGGGL